MSAAGFADAISADIAPKDDLLAISRQTSQELPKMLFVYKEVIMGRFPGRISQAIDLSLTFDATKPVVECRFCCVDDNLDVYHGLLDLQLPKPSPADTLDQPSCCPMCNCVDLKESAFQNVATSCASTRVNFPRAGNCHSGLKRSSKHSATSFQMVHPRPSGMPDLCLDPCPATKSGISTGIGCMNCGLQSEGQCKLNQRCMTSGQR